MRISDWSSDVCSSDLVMRAMRKGLQAAGIPVENSKGEWGPGLAEINVRYDEALPMADNHVLLKNACKELAYQKGKNGRAPGWERVCQYGSISEVSVSIKKKNLRDKKTTTKITQ